jgi:hypothetical protein
MRLATIRCPNQACRLEYSEPVERDRYYLACPGCGQYNLVPDDARTITGICEACGRAFDDHERAEFELACPPAIEAKESELE